MPRGPHALVFAFVATMVSMTGAQAHKLKAFATAVGAEVSGYAYFSPGGRAQDSQVTVTTPDGDVVASMRTNDEGEFKFTVTRHVDHTILVDAGDGHEATYKVAAEELPSTPGEGAITASVQSPPAPVGREPGASSAVEPVPPVSAAEIRAMVEQGISLQLRPLRQQIDAWQEKVWLHDVLGGLGYIIGLAGLAFGFMESRRNRKEAPARPLKEARR